MKTWLVSVVCCVMSLAIGSARVNYSQEEVDQGAPRKQSRALDSVPKPNEEEIRKIHSAADWRNPYLIVCAYGFELILKDRPRKACGISLAEVEKSLLDLPLQHWPLGRVVVVQGSSLRSEGDNEKIQENTERLNRILRSHKVRIELWPA